MVFGIGRKDPRDSERADQRHVPYKLATYEHDYEGKRFRSSNVVYSFWSASKYVLILSLMLWWLPMFGQMIAGYVGGRRAGGPWKGVAASILPVVALWAVMTGFDSGYLPSHMFGIAIAPAAIGTALGHSVPFIAPYIDFSSEYIGSFVQSLAGSSPYGINTYVLTVAFAYVGGVLAEQNRREIEFNSGAVMANTTVLVADKQGYMPELPEAGPQGHGVFSGIGAMLHWPRRYGDSQAAGYVAHGRRDAWSRAAEMRYEEDPGYYGDDRALPPAQAYDVEPLQGNRSRRLKHSKDGWSHKQKRRGRPNYSAKPRFGYPQFATEAPAAESPYGAVVSRRSKKFQRFTVGTDPKSIKRARKMIDGEWGRRKYQRLGEYDDQETDVEDEVEPEAAVHHRREHNQGRTWDTI
ncbi:MAG: hypothetical protein A3K67_04905 [Euryarchaeota archaeon RBG_16_62_10]|nr:MAG: hypothetical protein A3K67_04905 [Euryarchaeota archaeon RBG_16_62_10]